MGKMKRVLPVAAEGPEVPLWPQLEEQIELRAPVLQRLARRAELRRFVAEKAPRERFSAKTGTVALEYSVAR